MCNHCSIVPKFMREKLGNQATTTFVPSQDKKDQDFRERRIAALSRPKLFMNVIGQGNRKVYDSQNTENQRHKLVRKEGQAPVADAVANLVYDHALFIKEYFMHDLGWNSIDNHGLDIILNIHYGDEYNNAFWDGDEMTFGDGDNEQFIGFANAIDVTGHELSHGVVQYTAGLEYSKQPGALNEHFADVFGMAIKQRYKGQDEHTANWLMGDEIMGPVLTGKAIRSLKSPGDAVSLYAQPEHMNDYYHGNDDNYGVHINSGIPNKAFYLVAMKIGTFSAAKLWFEALKRLSVQSQFLDLYDALVESIPSLEAKGTIPTGSKNIVENAFRYVGII